MNVFDPVIENNPEPDQNPDYKSILSSLALNLPKEQYILQVEERCNNLDEEINELNNEISDYKMQNQMMCEKVIMIEDSIKETNEKYANAQQEISSLKIKYENKLKDQHTSISTVQKELDKQIEHKLKLYELLKQILVNINKDSGVKIQELTTGIDLESFINNWNDESIDLIDLKEVRDQLNVSLITEKYLKMFNSNNHQQKDKEFQLNNFDDQKSDNNQNYDIINNSIFEYDNITKKINNEDAKNMKDLDLNLKKKSNIDQDQELNKKIKFKYNDNHETEQLNYFNLNREQTNHLKMNEEKLDQIKEISQYKIDSKQDEDANSKKNSFKDENNQGKQNSVKENFDSKTLLNYYDQKNDLDDQDSKINLTKITKSNSTKYKDDYLLINTNQKIEQENKLINEQVKNPNNISNFNSKQNQIDLKNSNKKSQSEYQNEFDKINIDYDQSKNKNNEIKIYNQNNINCDEAQKISSNEKINRIQQKDDQILKNKLIIRELKNAQNKKDDFDNINDIQFDKNNYEDDQNIDNFLNINDSQSNQYKYQMKNNDLKENENPNKIKKLKLKDNQIQKQRDVSNPIHIKSKNDSKINKSINENYTINTNINIQTQNYNLYNNKNQDQNIPNINTNQNINIIGNQNNQDQNKINQNNNNLNQDQKDLINKQFQNSRSIKNFCESGDQKIKLNKRLNSHGSKSNRIDQFPDQKDIDNIQGNIIQNDANNQILEKGGRFNILDEQKEQNNIIRFKHNKKFSV